jgi:hypothetical protein
MLLLYDFYLSIDDMVHVEKTLIREVSILALLL